MKDPLARLRKLLIDLIIDGFAHDQSRLVDRLELEATDVDRRETFRFWARKVVADALSAAHKPTGQSPRHPADENGSQLNFGFWHDGPTAAVVRKIERYRDRFAKIEVRIALFDRVMALVRPYMADHEVDDLPFHETCRLAGVPQEDIDALAA